MSPQLKDALTLLKIKQLDQMIMKIIMQKRKRKRKRKRKKINIIKVLLITVKKQKDLSVIKDKGINLLKMFTKII